MGQILNDKVYDELIQQKWDVIVVGSGLGGLTAANLLAKHGKKVLVLERHTVPGGFTHTFSRKKFTWDVGVHYVGQVDDSRSLIRKVFDYVSEGELIWATMGPVYDRVVIEGDTYEFVSGLENQIKRLIQYFPEEEVAIRKYFALVKSVSSSSAWFFGEKTMPPWMSKTLGGLLRWKFKKESKRTTDEVLRSLTQNQRLISVLCAQCGNYGLLPKKSSFGIHAIVVDHYLNGGSYPKGGAGEIYETISRGIFKNGGAVLLKAEVEKVLVEEGKVSGVLLSRNRKISAPCVISNAGAWNTFKRLYPNEIPLPAKIHQGLDQVKPSVSHICLYVGLNVSSDQLGLPKNNVWVYPDSDFEGAYHKSLGSLERFDFDPPLYYISFPSVKDSEWSAKRPHQTTIQVVAPFAYEFVKKWENEPWMKRGKDYLELKEMLTQKLLNQLLIHFPQIKNTIEHCELSTPLSTRHFTNYHQGQIYGLEHTPERFDLPWLRPQTHLKGLYLTGQDIVTVGVGGALMSGVLTATAVLKKPSLIREILSSGVVKE